MLWNFPYTGDQMKEFLARAETKEGEDRDALYRVGECYWWGTGGVTTANQTEALRWWRRAADEGSGKAQWWLGFCHKLGRGGLERNQEQAQLWFRMALELLPKEEEEDAEAKYMPRNAISMVMVWIRIGSWRYSISERQIMAWRRWRLGHV